MKKKVFLALLMCLCLGFGLSAHAAGGYVSDAAGILSAEEIAALNDQAQTVSEYYDCGVYIVVVDDYTDYVRGSMQDFSEAVYNTYALGLGGERNGILLALSMAERDYDLCAYGDWAHYAFTDYGKDKLSDTFLDNFRNNDWFGGFNDYIGNSTSLMDMAKNGNPLDTVVYDDLPAARGLDIFDILIILVVSSAAGFAVCGASAARMKNTRRRSYANDYAVQGAAKLRLRSDNFLYHNVVRTRINRDNDGPSRPGGGRPGGTSINAGGFSHKGGKF